VSEGPACSPLMDEWMLSRAVKATCHPLGKKTQSFGDGRKEKYQHPIMPSSAHFPILQGLCVCV
jgi:hypothetical protein